MKPWDEMTPGERNALVAEKIFGWTDLEWRDTETGVDENKYRWFRRSGYYGKGPDGQSAFQASRYSTDISAAWGVLSKLHERGLSVEVKRWAYPGAEWIAEVGTGVRAEARTAPEAISLVALRAAGVEV